MNFTPQGGTEVRSRLLILGQAPMAKNVKQDRPNGYPLASISHACRDGVN